MTPLRILTGQAWPITVRRLLGLFAFAYVLLHFSVWVVLDFFFDWELMLADIVKRPYITVGMTALVLLTPLAATSTSGMIKRLGGKTWRRLHRLAYVAAILGVLHYLWLAKVGVHTPWIYAAVLTVLLAIRVIDAVRKRFGRAPARAARPARPSVGDASRGAARLRRAAKRGGLGVRLHPRIQWSACHVMSACYARNGCSRGSWPSLSGACSSQAAQPPRRAPRRTPRVPVVRSCRTVWS